MFHFDVTIEDVRVIADRVTHLIPGAADTYHWEVRCFDNYSGKMFPLQLTDSQMQLLSLLVMSDTLAFGSVAAAEAHAYEILDPLFKECPSDCRPFQ